MTLTRIQIIVAAVAALVLGGGGFVAGMTLAPAKTEATATQTAAGAQGQSARRSEAPGGARAVFVGPGGNQTAGRVISVNDGSLTVEVRTPGSDATRSVIVLVGGDARLVKTVETDIKLTDIKPGDQVVVAGTTDQTTGTVSANAVILGAGALQNVFGSGAPGASGAPIRRPGASASPSARP
ncbi:MAG: hypothetical protein HYX56_06975 [Chloroflexi bacterium]|nr:hypothetical protein [Chloroflexota bacterium]